MSQLAARMRTPLVLWAAMLASTGIYLLVLKVAAPPPQPVDPTMALALNAAGVMIAVSSVVVPMLVWRAALGTLRPQIEEVPDEDADAGLFRDAVPKKRVVRGAMAFFEAAHTKGFAPFVLSLALSEAVCLVGFVLAFMGHPPIHWAPLYAVGVLLLAARFPTIARLTGSLERHFDAELVGVPGSARRPARGTEAGR
ncbi:MAG: hypothetical protein AAGH15_00310 [Myxococcota bacterium]